MRRPVSRYHGGKFMLAQWIISHFPKHENYVEPYGGAASVLLQKPRCYCEVYNDRWENIVNVFRVLRDPKRAQQLKELIELTPYARAEFADTTAEALAKVTDDVERARRVLFRAAAGFGSGSINGDHSTGFRKSARGRRAMPAQDWMNYPEQIASFTKRLAGVVIECRPALDVIDSYDDENTLFYVDPPYVHQTRNMKRGNAQYAHDMTDEDHRQLAAKLRRCKGMVIVSGYPCALYDRELYGDWERTTCRALADGARPRIECLWANAKAAQATLFQTMEATA